VSPSARAGLRLAAYLRARLLPWLALMLGVVALGAPGAALLLGLRETRAQGALVAQQAAEIIASEDRDNPRLWRYNTPKLMAHLGAARERPDVGALEVVDASGRRVETGLAAAPAGGPLVWERAPIALAGGPVGEVWVGMRAGGVVLRAALVFALFLALGLLLAALLLVLPLRSLASAESLGQALDELQTLSRRAARLQEGERRAIARELHDGVGGALTAVRLHLTRVQAAAAAGAPDLAALAAQAAALTDQAVEEVRRAVRSLGPALLDELGLLRAAQRLLDDFAARGGPALRARLPEALPRLGPELEGALFRALQEALTNVTRHAQARQVEVRLAWAGGGLELEVRDDGVGFELTTATAGQGLTGLRERVTLLSGRVELEAAPGRGTRVRVWVPAACEEVET
jgi:signal transduction histidine kinase